MIHSGSISNAYLAMLGDILHSGSQFMQVACVTNPAQLESETAFHEKLDFKFPDGRTGRWWLENRMKAMFDAKGEYGSRLHQSGLDYVINTLKGMAKGKVPRWNANRLIVTLFDPTKDLHESRAPTPPCMISLTFYPTCNNLSLVGTFRAQYVDAKGYGNLYSLAVLLNRVANETGFKPCLLYNVAQKTLLKYPKLTVKRFYASLFRS